MELTRREALGALGAAGAVAGGLGAATYSGIANEESRPAATVLALAETVYPSEVSVEPSFVRTYLGTRTAGADELDARALAATLDDYAVGERGFAFAELSRSEREALLRDVGVASTPPNPEGTAVERLHYLVNDLLFGLYATPAGGELAGNPNPQGHPGGLEHYRREP
jgi:hypothetical protein